MMESKPLPHYISAFFRDEIHLARGLSGHTYRSYKIALKSCMEFIGSSYGKPMSQLVGDDVSYELIYAWMLERSQKCKWSKKTWNTRLSAIKTFARFLLLKNIRYMDMVTRVVLIKSKRSSDNPADYMTLEEFNQILKTIRIRKHIDFRDKLIFQLLFFSGARVAELTALQTQDIQYLDRNSVSLFLTGKGRKTRSVIIKEKATVQNIKKYLSTHQRLNGSSNYMFMGSGGNRMSEKNISRIVDKHFKGRLGQRKISPHSFRHSAAMHWLESGIGIFVVSSLLGHEDIQTTTKYLKSTFKIKSDALDASEQNTTLSQVFAPKYSTNEEFWEHLGFQPA